MCRGGAGDVELLFPIRDIEMELAQHVHPDGDGNGLKLHVAKSFAE